MSHRATAFPKTFRLTTAAEYRKVFDSAYRSIDNGFLMLARENTQNIPRLGLAISKKHLRLAVQRNRIKRLIRESFRLHQEELTGLDIVVLAQKRTLKKSNNELIQSMELHWKKIVKCAKS